MKAMLDRAMEVELDNAEADLAGEEYKSRFKFLYDLFDKKPFVLKSQTDAKERVSAAVYDSAMVAMNNRWDSKDLIAADKAQVLVRMADANADEEKYEVLVGRGNTAEAVRDRISLLERVLIPDV